MAAPPNKSDTLVSVGQVDPERNPLDGGTASDATRIDGKARPRPEPLAPPPFDSIFDRGMDAARYEVRRLLGEGGYGRVYAAFDRDLQRAVALKVVTPPEGAERELFVREARVTAGLVHPNIPAVYDVAERDGTFYFSMEQVSGQSLGSMIRAAAMRGDQEVMPHIELIEIMLKVTDALEYAHAEGVVHRDVKPDNIVAGSYGRVVLIDWGASHVIHAQLGEKALVIGTPAYMAPEQLSSSAPTPAADIYGLGATLFHALLLRAPLARTDAEGFWASKARGSVDPPTSVELARAPRALLGVAMKAMSAAVQDRYPSMKALGEALRDVLVGRKAWMVPLHETLSDDSYQDRWLTIPEGAFERDGARLVSKGADHCLLVYKQRLAAGVAVEFDGQIIPGQRPGDLSVMWTEDEILEPAPRLPERDITTLQIGAFDNLTVGIYRDFWQCLCGRALSIEVGRAYQVRAEVDEQAFRLFLNGELIAEHSQVFSIPSGYIAIYSHAPGKSISNIRLFERTVPERISPTAIGDAFYSREDYVTAAAHYARVEERLPSSDIAEEARFKRGLSLLRGGQPQLAQELWGALRADAWRTRALLHLIDLDFEARNHTKVCVTLRQLLDEAPSARVLVIDRWVRYVHTLCASDVAPLSNYIALRERYFQDDPGSAAAAAQLELARGNFSVVVERFADQPPQHFGALCSLGNFSEATERYRSVPWMYELSESYRNHFDNMRHDATRALALALRGELDAALKVGGCVEAMVWAERYDEVRRYRFTSAPDYAATLRGEGKLEEAVARGDARALCQLDVDGEALGSPLVLEERLYLLHHLALRSFTRGDLLAYQAHRTTAAATPCSATWDDSWLHRHFLFPILERELGDATACERSARRVISDFSEHWRAKGLHLARFVVGEIDLAEFTAQPVRMFMRARALLAQALRAEYLRDSASAAELYREYLRLPKAEHFSDSSRGDPVLERWAAFRAHESAVG